MSARSIARAATPPATATTGSVGIWLRMLACHDLILGSLRRELEGTVTQSRFDLLANLQREDGQTLAALSRRMLVTAGNLTGLVDRAARDGLVVRRADPRDRRLWRVYLTHKGRALVAELVPRHAAQVETLFSGLDAGERRELRRLLAKLEESLA